MELVKLLTEFSNDVGTGLTNSTVKALEAKLDFIIPSDFREYLITLNYAEIFGDPIYGIHMDDSSIDLYSQNKHQEHFKYGFLAVFNSDIDGTLFLRQENGAVYNASFSQPIATSFTGFIKDVLSNGT